MAKVTRESLQNMLDNTNPLYVERVVGRALVAIFKRQTSSEQSSNETTVHNGIGFTACDARAGSVAAKTFLRDNKLFPGQVNKWLKRDKKGFSRLTKYHRQLNEIAEKDGIKK